MKNKKFIIIGSVILVLVIGFFIYQKMKTTSQKVQYVTEDVSKGTIVSTVTVSGSITSSNYSSVNTVATGSVKKVYVKDGDEVSPGDKLVEIELDQDGMLAQTKAYSAYLSANNALDDANINKMSLENSLAQSKISANSAEQQRISLLKSLETAQASLKNAQIALTKDQDDKRGWTQIEQSKLQLRAAEEGVKLAQAQYDSVDDSINKANTDVNISQEKFDNADNQISKAKSDLLAATISYRNSKPLITSQIKGKISGLSVFEGMVLVSSSNTSSSNTTSTSGQKILSISNQSNPLMSVTVSESDISKIKVDQKATITLDALIDKTFTGKVVTIDRVGQVSSGVTSYPVTIQFDTLADGVLPNMSATASIILDSRQNVISVTSSALTQASSGYTVNILVNNGPQAKNVEVGLSSDTATEIISGLAEGEKVIVSTISPTASSTTATKSNSTTSIFGGVRTGGNSLGSSGNARTGSQAVRPD